MDPVSHLQNDDSAPFEDVACYSRLICRLHYLTTTRLDISFPIQQLSQFLSKPTICHFRAAQRVLHYLKGAPGQGLFFSRKSTLQLHGFQ